MQQIRYILLLWVATSLTLFSGTAEPREDSLAVIYTLEGDVEHQYNELVEKKISKVGFNVSNPHHQVNNQYEKKWGSTALDTLSFLSVTNDQNLFPLMLKDPRIAAFAPFNMLIYKKKSETTTTVGHLTPKVMLDIIGIEDQQIRTTFSEAFKPLDKMVDEAFPNAEKSYLPYQSMAKNDRMIQYEYSFERPEDLDDFIDTFQNSFELAFINSGYLIAGYHNFKDNDDDEVLEAYDAFWTYSLCHLEFSYNMFDNEGARPEAGLFAPCTMYVYIRAESNTLVFGMPTLNNWVATLGIKSEKRVALANRLVTEIPSILEKYGMKRVNNVNLLTATEEEKKYVAALPAEAAVTQAEPTEATPIVQSTPVEAAKKEESASSTSEKVKTITVKIPKPPKVPTPVEVKTIGGNMENDHILDRSIKFSKRQPPNWDPEKYSKTPETKTEQQGTPGEVTASRISAHLRGSYMEVAAVEETLKSNGFSVITAEALDKKKELISVVFTNDTLMQLAAKPNRGFMATLRVLINNKEKTISITNPLYLAKAFMQEEFDETAAKALLAKINTAFPGLKNSEDALKFQLLPTYQFMKGLPHYENMQVIKRGDALEKKLENNKKVIFSQKLENGSILVGVKLNKRTAKFINKIGTNNAAMLPYPVLIENGEAKILDPKYYIAIMYPMLKMSEFMTIATIPDAIKKDCQRAFR